VCIYMERYLCASATWAVRRPECGWWEIPRCRSDGQVRIRQQNVPPASRGVPPAAKGGGVARKAGALCTSVFAAVWTSTYSVCVTGVRTCCGAERSLGRAAARRICGRAASPDRQHGRLGWLAGRTGSDDVGRDGNWLCTNIVGPGSLRAIRDSECMEHGWKKARGRLVGVDEQLVAEDGGEPALTQCATGPGFRRASIYISGKSHPPAEGAGGSLLFLFLFLFLFPFSPLPRDARKRNSVHRA